MKKLIATFLILSLLFTCFHSVFAQQTDAPATSETEASTDISPTEIVTEEDTSAEIPSQEDTDENILRMWICSRIQGYIPTGHSWLYFENISNEPVYIATYELLPGEGVSVGSCPNFAYGFGVYFNIECYKGNHNGICAKSTLLTAEELETVNGKICNNNFWEFFFNCVFFATNVWNSVADVYSHYTFFPLLSMLDIVIWGGDYEELEMQTATQDEIFRLRKGDEGFYLEQCDGIVLFQILDRPEPSNPEVPETEEAPTETTVTE